MWRELSQLTIDNANIERNKEEVAQNKRKRLEIADSDLDDSNFSEASGSGTINEAKDSIKNVLSAERVEILKDLYIPDIKEEFRHNYLFEKSLVPAKICQCCHGCQKTLYKCNGFCQKWYHKTCVDFHFETVPDINSNEDTKKSICSRCSSKDFKQCIICNFGKTDSKLFDCGEANCNLSYHSDCLFPSIQEKETFVCPQHYCNTCYSRELKGNNLKIVEKKLVKCIKCPVSFHQDSLCIAAGSIILSQTQILCPRDALESKNSVKKQKSVQIYFCLYCYKSEGNLIKCKMCPVSFHQECCQYNENNQELCNYCQTGRFTIHNEIIWGKYMNFRWWPCIVLPEIVLQDRVLEKRKYAGNFAVRFFGTKEYGFLSWDRVCAFKAEHLQNYQAATGTRPYKTALEEAVDTLRIIKESQPKFIPVKSKIPTKGRASIKKQFNEQEDGFTCDCDDDCSEECVNRVMFYECCKSLCKAGDNCKNQRFQKKQYCQVKTFDAGPKGTGLLADQNIEMGSFIIEYSGEFMNQEEMEKRLSEKLEKKDTKFYFMHIEKNLYVDAEFKGNLSRFINHSCDPNCEIQKWIINGQSRIGIFAINDIEQDTELTFHYNFENRGDSVKRCHCGSSNCCGYMTKKNSKSLLSQIEYPENEAGTSKALKQLNVHSNAKQPKRKKLKLN